MGRGGGGWELALCLFVSNRWLCDYHEKVREEDPERVLLCEDEVEDEPDDGELLSWRKPRATATGISRSSPRLCEKLSATAMATTEVAATGLSMPRTRRKSRQNPGAPRSAGRDTCSSNADDACFIGRQVPTTTAEGSDQTCAADRRQCSGQRR